MRDIRSSALAGLAGVLTAGAGLVHAAAAGTHAGDATLVRMFALAAVVQVLAGAFLASRPTRAAVGIASIVNLASVGAWIASRTVGIAFIPSLAVPEAVGLQDLTVTLMEAAAVLVAIASLRLAPRRKSAAKGLTAAAMSPMWVLAIAPTLLGMTAPHTHGASHDHGAHGTSKVAVGLAADPIFSGGDTSHATEDQLRVAADLILRTRAAVRAHFPDEASVIAAGYTSIGDGFLFGAFEHFVHPGYMHDGRALDPDRIESIVVESTPTGKWVASAMFILEPGQTMADIPDIAGTLTTWHDHQNICWDSPEGTRMAGFVRDGKCVPSGYLRATPPMLHVWLRDNACGPFAGVEGHGTATCTHTHAAA
ncbi:MAG: hypothetical protein QOE93_1080 [Actinomycetota bacterium]|jgi:hypothetical protein|nr:hypothetical protein [Actinomycetota bacterium]